MPVSQMTEEQLEETLWDIDRTAQTSNYGNFELQGQVEFVSLQMALV